MRFMLLQAYGRVELPGCTPMHEWDPEDVKAHIEFQHTLNPELLERGELVDAQGLAGPDQAKVVVSDGVSAPRVIDGPYPESKELLAGYRLIDVDSLARALGAVVRRHGDFADAEDAVQEALVAASQQWPSDLPTNPLGWLVAVASRRLIDDIRSNDARRRREDIVALLDVPLEASDKDDSLLLLFLCCHEALSPTLAIPLTLRTVAGLTTREIAAAYLVPEATMAQRIRLARMLHASLPAHPEVAGLLALMLLTDARRPACTGPSGELVPLAEQDRSRWDRARIGQGMRLLTAALKQREVGEYSCWPPSRRCTTTRPRTPRPRGPRSRRSTASSSA